MDAKSLIRLLKANREIEDLLWCEFKKLSLRDRITCLHEANYKVRLVKEYRDLTLCSLMFAKEQIDKIWDKPNRLEHLYTLFFED